MAWHGVVTNAGAELIRSFTANNKLNIGSIQTGTGSVAIDQMRARTALVTQKAAKGLCGANIAKMEEVDGGIRLLIQVNSTSGAYVCKEIGVWGGLGDDNSSTLIMYIMSDGNGVSIPDSSDLPDYSFLIAAVLGVSNVSNVIVNIDTTVNATRQYVDEEAAKKVNIAQGTANNGKVMMVGADGNVTPTEYPTMTGATSSTPGKKGSVPAPSVANRDKYLRGDGTWNAPNAAELTALDAYLKRNIDAPRANIIDLIYPVGSIYMSVSNTSPNTLFPGSTWAALANRFLVGAGSEFTAGATGGAKSVSYTPAGTVGGHALTTSEMPVHTHTFTGSEVTSGANSRGHTHSFTPAGSINSVADHKHSVGAHSHGIGTHTHSVTVSGSTADGGAQHTHTVPAHAHSLNNHKHTFRPNGTVTSGAHTHAIKLSSSSGAIKSGGYGPAQSNYIGFGQVAAASGGIAYALTSTGGSSNPIEIDGYTESATPSFTFSGTETQTEGATGNTGESAALTSGAATPTHKHTINISATTGAAASTAATAASTAFDSGAAGGHGHTFTGTAGTTGDESRDHTHKVTAAGTNSNAGGGAAHSHGFTGTQATIDTLPPYLAVYMWKRTA